VLPTIAGLLGLDVSGEPVQGRDLSGALLRGEKLKEQPVHLDLTRRGRSAVVVGGRKLILSRAAIGEQVEWYDLAADPGETRRLAPPDPARIAALRKWLADTAALGRRLVAAAKDRSPLRIDEKTLRRLRGIGYLDGGTRATRSRKPPGRSTPPRR
jgi:hypothetical protein